MSVVVSAYQVVVFSGGINWSDCLGQILIASVMFTIALPAEKDGTADQSVR